MQANNNRMKWIFYAAGSLLGVVILIFSLNVFLKQTTQPEATDSAETRGVVDVAAAVAGNESLSEYITLNGVTRFLITSTIRSHVTGYVSSLHYGINSMIRRGSLFCTVKTKEQDALRDIRRVDTSMKYFDKPLTVFSNASGLITAINIHNGDYVSEGDILATVTEPSSLILVVNVPFEYNRQIRIGTPCEVIFSDNRKLNLAISGILPTVDPTSQTQSYFIRIPDQHLPENLNVTLHLMTRKSSESSLTIPASALQTDELEKEFWVMKIQQGIAYKTPVQPGSQNAELVEIKGGNLMFGDSIVTEGSYQLEDSSRVSVWQ